MTTWTVISEFDDPKRAGEMFEEQRSKGYNVRIEDENGNNVDEEFLKKIGTKRIDRSVYELGMATLIWGTAAVIGFGVLYALSFLAGD
jgi:hypothetical protein